jgi:hypothetical protein
VVARSVSLVATVALLFGLPRCAIDDRDLDVTEGSGGNGGSGGTSNLPAECRRDGDDDDCFACAKERCCAQYAECNMNTACGDYVSCGDECADDDTACFDLCDDQYPIGSALFYGFAACGLTQCPDLCDS